MTSGQGGEVSSPQPGGRRPAPGGLALVQAFINSHYDLVVEHGRDLFEDPAALADWLARHGLTVRGRRRLGRQDLRRAVAVREALRELAYANNDGRRESTERAIEVLNRAARGATMEVRLAGGGPRLVAVAPTPLDHALGVLLGTAARAMIDGSWLRLKACPGRDCGWVFYDHSRNQSGRWCSMAVCGGREKARAHYRRRSRGTD